MQSSKSEIKPLIEELLAEHAPQQQEKCKSLWHNQAIIYDIVFQTCFPKKLLFRNSVPGLRQSNGMSQDHEENGHGLEIVQPGNTLWFTQFAPPLIFDPVLQGLIAHCTQNIAQNPQKLGPDHKGAMPGVFGRL